MAIVIPNRNEKIKSQIIDAFRISAWEEYKSSYEGDLKGLELYEKFKEEWLAHEIHTMSLNQLKELMRKYEYDMSSISAIRTEYYQKRKAYQDYASYKQFADNRNYESSETSEKKSKKKNNNDEDLF